MLIAIPMSHEMTCLNSFPIYSLWTINKFSLFTTLIGKTLEKNANLSTIKARVNERNIISWIIMNLSVILIFVALLCVNFLVTEVIGCKGTLIACDNNNECCTNICRRFSSSKFAYNFYYNFNDNN